MATKEIIVLGQQSNGTQVTYNVLFWYPITANPVSQTAGSAWVPSGTSAGAATAENQAIQAGTIKEEGASFSFPVGTPVSAIEAVLQQSWAKRNAQIAGQGANQYYGSWYDGTQWSAS